LEIKDLFTIFREKLIFKGELRSTIAKTEAGETCALHKKIGKGFFTAFGFAFSYSSDEHLHLFEKIISFSKIKRHAKVNDPDIQFVLRKGRKSTYLFLLNYHNQKKTFKVNSKKFTLNPFSCKIIKQKK